MAAETDQETDPIGSVFKNAVNESAAAVVNALYWGDFVEIRRPVYGFLFPVFSVIVLITNTFVCIVLTRKEQRQSPTNVLLIGIAVFDTLTCTFYLPMLLFYFAFDNVDWVPYDWCYVFKLTLMFIPAMFHTTSLWITIAMAAQRYYIVRNPFKVHLVTRKKTIIMIICAFLLGVSVHILKVFDSSFDPVEVPSKKNASVYMTGCVEVSSPWITDHATYFTAYFIVRCTFQNLIPSIVLLVLNVMLIHGIRSSLRKREALQSLKKTALYQREAVNKRTTAMLIAIVAVTVCTEIPTMVCLLVFVLPSLFGINLVSAQVVVYIIVLVDLVVQIGYPLNFVIYCWISSKFRKAFTDLFCLCITTSTEKNNDSSLQQCNKENNENRGDSASGSRDTVIHE